MDKFMEWLSFFRFFDDVNSGYIHSQNSHSGGIFSDTSHIEGLWGEIKFQLKKLYSSISVKKFCILFIPSRIYRRSTKTLNKNEKKNNFSIVCSYMENGNNGDFLKEAELISIDCETIFDN